MRRRKPKINDHGFSHTLDQNDDRQIVFTKQREVRGFDQTELWSLDVALAKHVLPRLAAFREQNGSCPFTFTLEKWNSILDKMIFSFKFAAEERQFDLQVSKRTWIKVEQGLRLFSKHFFSLWT